MSWRRLAVSLSPPSSLALQRLSSKMTASAAHTVTTQRQEEVGGQGHPAKVPCPGQVTWPLFLHGTWQERASSQGGHVSRGWRKLGRLLRLALCCTDRRIGVLLAGKGEGSARNTSATVGQGATSAIFTNVTAGQRPVVTDKGWALQHLVCPFEALWGEEVVLRKSKGEKGAQPWKLTSP